MSTSRLIAIFGSQFHPHSSIRRRRSPSYHFHSPSRALTSPSFSLSYRAHPSNQQPLSYHSQPPALSSNSLSYYNWKLSNRISSYSRTTLNHRGVKSYQANLSCITIASCQTESEATLVPFSSTGVTVPIEQLFFLSYYRKLTNRISSHSHSVRWSQPLAATLSSGRCEMQSPEIVGIGRVKKQPALRARIPELAELILLK